MAILETMVGIQILSSLAQLWQSEKARGASKDRLNQVESMFNNIKPPQYDVSVIDPPEYITEVIPPAEVDLSKLTPEQYRVVGQLVPEAAPYIAEAAPNLVRDTAAGREGKDATLAALRRLRGIASGSDPVSDAKFNQLARRVQGEAGSRDAAILRGAEERGALTSGLTSAAQLQSGAAAMDRLAGMGVDNLGESRRNALMALRDSGALGRNIRGDDLSLEETNADIINQFNQRTSSNYQNYMNARANMANQAQMQNLQTAQNVANMNVDTANKFAVNERNRQDDIARDRRRDLVEERANQNKIQESVYNAKLGNQQRYNQAQADRANWDIGIAKGKAGIAGDLNQFDIGAAEARNRAIQGMANAGTDYAYMDEWRNLENQRRWDDRAKDFENSYGYLDYDEMGTPEEYRWRPKRINVRSGGGQPPIAQ
jgi:hypothetical protein